MFTTLRSRLWLSYALVIATALSIIGFILLAYLLRNPGIDREVSAKLFALESVLLEREESLLNLPLRGLQTATERVDRTYGVRVVILTNERRVIADSRRETDPELIPPQLPRLARANLMIRDSDGKAWIYSLRRLNNDRWLMLSAPRPQIRPFAILRDEFFPPLSQAGLAALLLSLVLAYLIARWVADPLQRIIQAAHKLPDVPADPLPVGGPREVQELLSAFNEMSNRVQISQKSQREFVANVSHELKTPLTSIQGFAQAILDGTAGSAETQHQAAEIILTESGRMHRMVLDLLDLAKLEGGIADLTMAPVNLPSLLNSVNEKFSIQAQKKGISITLVADNIPTIIGDGDRLAQVFTNLVDNALKFTPEGGNVSLNASLISPEIVEIALKDSGAGIPESALPHIFDRFFQVDPSRGGGEKHGSGLGLAIANEIIQAHSGKITAWSQAGKGSAFTVQLPVMQPDVTTIVSQRK